MTTTAVESSPEKLFHSTAQSLEFWLSVAQKRETMPKNAYLEFLNSFGWNRRSASPYVKLADFIREHLPLQIGAIAKLDIRTLLKLSLPRYAPIVEEIKATAPTQAQVSELIKKLPTKPRDKYKSVEEKKDETFELNVPVQTGKLISETAELMGLTRQKAIEVNCELVRQLITGVDPAIASARFKDQFVRNDEEVGTAPEETADCEPGMQEDFVPAQVQMMPYGLELGDPVQWRGDTDICASYLTQVEDGNALLSVDDEIYSVPLANLKKIDLEAIKEEIRNHKKLSYPYQQLYINAANAKQEWKTLQALPDGDKTYDWQFQQYHRWISYAEGCVRRNEIWVDWDELVQNQRLILVPGGEDLIKDVANIAKPKYRVTKTSFLEAFSSGVAEVPSLEQQLKDADNWDEITLLVRHNNKTLDQATESWTIGEKHLLIAKLATFLENSFESAIQDNELSWLHQDTLAKALAKLEFEVNQEVCRFHKIVGYATSGELWSFRTEKGETLTCPRTEIKIFKF